MLQKLILPASTGVINTISHIHKLIQQVASKLNSAVQTPVTAKHETLVSISRTLNCLLKKCPSEHHSVVLCDAAAVPMHSMLQSFDQFKKLLIVKVCIRDGCCRLDQYTTICRTLQLEGKVSMGIWCIPQQLAEPTSRETPLQ